MPSCGKLPFLRTTAGNFNAANGKKLLTFKSQAAIVNSQYGELLKARSRLIENCSLSRKTKMFNFGGGRSHPELELGSAW